ncbi:MAG: hypothetical protein RR370_02785 [Synergistaceae bacterium]
MLSVISNFGCDTGCEYCIWKGHKLSGVKTTYENTDWGKLRSLTEKLTEVSVSGGGDPLFNYEDNRNWWGKLFEICGDTKVELHTSKIMSNWEHIDKLGRYVLHIEPNQLDDLSEKIEELSERVNLRLVFVMNDSMTTDNLMDISRFCSEYDIELSFRQLVISGETQYILHDFLKDGHENFWHYIEQCDYNLYYMPDNKIYDKYQF